MRERTSLEIKVGLLSIVGLIILAVLVFSIGDFDPFGQRKKIRLIFGFAGGVDASAPVRMTGVKVGEVKRVQLIYDDVEKHAGVQVEAWLDKDIKLYEDAEVYINTLGLLGEKYVEILNPGSPTARPIEDGGTLRGHDPVPIERITENTHRILDQLEDLITGLNDIVSDEEVRLSVKESIHNIRSTAGNLSHITSAIRSGEGSIGNFVYNDSLYRELEGFAREIRARPWRLLKVGRDRSGDRNDSGGPAGPGNKGFIN